MAPRALPVFQDFHADPPPWWVRLVLVFVPAHVHDGLTIKRLRGVWYLLHDDCNDWADEYHADR